MPRLESSSGPSDDTSQAQGSISTDQALTDILAAADDALAAAAGQAEINLPASSDGFDLTDSPGGPKLERGLACLRLLDRLRPGRRVDEIEKTHWDDPTWQNGHPTTIGRFQIRRRLGQGGFGVVYLAYDSQLLRQVALKVPHARTLLTRELRERFQLEASAAAGLDHPNVVPVYDCGDTGSTCYIASAYCPGVSLSAWLRERQEPIPARSAAALLAQVAAGVHHAHERGILHRDLKPANILLTPIRAGKPSTDEVTQEFFSTSSSDPIDFLPRITDFGLAKRTGEWESDGGINEDPAAPLTKTGAIMGTPMYMAPEQAAGRTKELAPSTDVHALGVILYEMLTGQTPYVAESTYDTLRRVQDDEPLPPSRLRPKLPRDLETICLKCLEKEQRRRYPSALELKEDLERFLDQQSIQARSVGRLERTWRWSRREPLVAGLVSLLAVVIVSALIALTSLSLKARAQAAVAVKERNAAIDARLRAEGNLDQARTLVTQLTELADRMASQPALAQSRRTILEKLLSFHESFLKQRSEDPGVLFLSAQAYQSVARIRSDLGQVEESTLANERAAVLLDELLVRDPTNIKYRSERAWHHFWTAIHQSVRMKRMDLAEVSFTKGLAMIEKLHGESPDSQAMQSALAVHLANRATALINTGRVEEAEQHISRALTLGRSILAQSPDGHWAKINLSLFLDSQASIDWRHKHPEQAIARSKEAVQLLTSMLPNPDAPSVTRFYLTRILNRQARMVNSQGKLAEAEALYIRSLEAIRSLCASYPDMIDYRNYVALTSLDLAKAIPTKTRKKDAIAAFQVSRQEYRKLLSDFPDNTTYRNRLIDCHRRLGDLLRDSDLVASMEAYRALIALQPKDALALNEIAWIDLTAADSQLRNNAEGLAFAQHAVATDPSQGNFLNTLGVAHYRNLDFPSARKFLEESIQKRKRPQVMDELFLAMTCWKLGQRDLATKYLQQADEMAKKFKAPDPEYQRLRVEADALLSKQDGV